MDGVKKRKGCEINIMEGEGRKYGVINCRNRWR